ncbi:Isochorismate synthase @ Menaquinone-specific isochorismate synthase [Leucobacter sp. 7(1)]|uniref:isochorismate synthase n=1 Tax=Leucobacter sp. 7(1) TaxID=1255613 RepID=UPI00097EAC62|nr:isochorismate synthase [Leucobacter sp. 7(1)]SJN09090.1 Isochorismate synthase @ Menaquinone-specific isochorismate synthase [Leucobacter sp. 7(1)]
MTSESAVPRLRAVTRPLSGAPDLLSLADPASPLIWLRGDRGCVGIGEALRVTFRGPQRFRDAAATWRRIAELATIDDPVALPGSGLVALGTFAFDDASAAESVLIVPQLLVARHRDRWWITRVTRQADEDAEIANQDPALPLPTPSGVWSGVTFAPRTNLADTEPDPVDAYLAGVSESVRRIARGEVEKIVLARQIQGHLPAGSDLRVPLARLAERYLDCWTFAVDGIVGASPETLIRSTAGAVSARVLAGTRARHAESPERDAQARDELLTSDKEQHEHVFAVQSVVTALAPHVSEMRTSEEPFPLQLPNVWHLATDLGASLRERSSAIELVGALHPTAAIAGTPTADAVAAIAELEPFDRGRYSGAVGWIDAAGDGEWVIALRCAQVDPAAEADPARPRRVTASAGGGIVAGSDPGHEFGETVSKFRPITEAFAE